MSDTLPPTAQAEAARRAGYVRLTAALVLVLMPVVAIDVYGAPYFAAIPPLMLAVLHGIWGASDLIRASQL